MHSGIVRFIGAKRFKYLAGQVRMDLEPGRIGFMSTQRRGNRWQRISCRVCHGVTKQACFTPAKGYALQTAKVKTAPPLTAGLATNSLQSDYRTTQLVQPVRLVLQATRLSSPPSMAGRCAVAGSPSVRRSSLPPIPSPSVLVRLHPALPQFPVADRRWTERYDGKRDLYFLHAA